MLGRIFGFIFCMVFSQQLLARVSQQLVYGETGRIDTLDPYTIHEASAQRLSDLLFDSLVDVGPSGEYQPSLAKSWTVDNTGMAVTFELRERVKWNSSDNSQTFSAKDVVTTVHLLQAPASEIPNKERFAVIADAEALSPSRVRIKFRRALADPLRACLFKIIPHFMLGKVTALKRDNSFTQNPVGTGPYAFVQANAQGEILLKANLGYFRNAPKISSILLKNYADQSVMAQSLMFNSLDLITYVSPRDLGEIMGDSNLATLPYDALSFSFFAMNTSRGVLKDKRVRQAICHAINRKEMLQAFFQGKGRLITGPFPPTSWAYNLDVKPMDFDVAAAKSLLADAGLTNKRGDLTTADGKPVSLVFAVPLAGESEMVKRIVLALQNYMATVGIKVDLQFMDWLVWKKRVLADHDYDMTIASWSFDDASNITSLFHSSSAQPWGNNFVLYRNTEVDALLTEAEATNDPDKRSSIYHKLHAVLADEVPYAYLWTLTHHAAFNSRVMGVRIEPFAFFKYIGQWELKPLKGEKK